MTSARPYRAALSTDEALDELERVAGTSSTLRSFACSPRTCETASMQSTPP